MTDELKRIIPDGLNDPDRFAKVAQRHLKAFRWEDQGWIPLGLIVNDPRHSEGITYDQWLDPEVILEFQAKMLRDTLEVGSDIMPAVGLNHLGNALVPSAFGAEISVPNDRVTSIQDAGPWILPLLKRIEDVDELGLPSLPSGLVAEAERFMTFYHRHLPGWVRVISPAKTAPFSIAQLLRGSAFYEDLHDDPERCHKLLRLCTDCSIEIERYLRAVVAQPADFFCSQFGIRGLGLRLGDDSMINVSTAMIREFVLPYAEHMGRAFAAPVYLHFCTLEHRRIDHIYPTLLDAPSVFAASSQFAFEYYEKNVDRLAGRLAIESFYGGALDYITRKFGSFEAWARQFVPRFKNRSGLILYFEVPSVAEGKRHWQTWQCAHDRPAIPQP